MGRKRGAKGQSTQTFGGLLVSFDDAIKRAVNGNSQSLLLKSNYIPPNICFDSSFDILHFQPEGDLKTGKNSIGFERLDDRVVFDDFLKDTLSKKPDLVLSPEYSVPLDTIKTFILVYGNALAEGVLYALGCEGVENSAFWSFIDNLRSNGVFVPNVDRVYKNQNGLVSALLYLTKLKFESSDDSTEIIVIPQLKTHPMSSRVDFESELIRGKEVYYSKGNDFVFASLICADVMNLNLMRALSKETRNRNALIFNPQLNSDPRHGTFRYAETLLVEESEKEANIKFLSLNWAEDTHVNQKPHIEKPWSGIREKLGGKSLDRSGDFIEVSRTYVKHGIELTFSDSEAIWLFAPRSHIMDYTVDFKPRPNSPGLADIKKVSYRKDHKYSYGKCLKPIPSFVNNTPEIYRLWNCKIYDNNNLPCSEAVCKRDRVEELLQGILWHERFPAYDRAIFANRYNDCDDSRRNGHPRNGDLRDVYTLRDSQIARVTAKHYGGHWSKDALYRFRRIHKRLLYEFRRKCTENTHQFSYLPSMVCDDKPRYNVEFIYTLGYCKGQPVIVSEKYCIAHIKNASEEKAKKFHAFICASLELQDQPDQQDQQDQQYQLQYRVIVFFEDAGNSAPNSYIAGLLSFSADKNEINALGYTSTNAQLENKPRIANPRGYHQIENK
ncbi:MAG: hypothetical protein LBH28_02540 [Oscillospiraceae bacterium]|jgi:hypothetical protein|nr:hypothetical protein [Oscillospiraceae bacterium]